MTKSEKQTHNTQLAQVSEKVRWQGTSTLSLTCLNIQSCKYNRIHYYQKEEFLIMFSKQRNFIRNHNDNKRSVQMY